MKKHTMLLTVLVCSMYGTSEAVTMTLKTEECNDFNFNVCARGNKPVPTTPVIEVM